MMQSNLDTRSDLPADNEHGGAQIAGDWDQPSEFISLLEDGTDLDLATSPACSPSSSNEPTPSSSSRPSRRRTADEPLRRERRPAT
jgi:hypothetical protein